MAIEKQNGKTNSEPDKIMRSLLQKAVRRGNIDTVKRILVYLINHDDFDWVRKRLASITFEECWTYSSNISYEKDPEIIIKHYLNIACSVKNKSATGLGSFAYELFNGNNQLEYFLGKDDFNKIKFVAEGIKNPENFWDWAIIKAKDDDIKTNIINKSIESSKKVSWQWDKAFVFAGAYLSLTQEIPKTKYKMSEMELPYWVGIDKHTPLGKSVIRKAAYEKGIDEDKAMLISFYCEGALMNNLIDSFWWNKEIEFRLSNINLNYEKAFKIWESMKERISQLLYNESLIIQQKLNSVDPQQCFRPKQQQQQMGLF